LGVYDLFKGREIERFNRLLVFPIKSTNDSKEKEM